jgi:hypothetical protein
LDFAILSNRFALMDLSSIESTDFPTVCLIIAYMLDDRRDSRYYNVTTPSPYTEAGKIFRLAQLYETVTNRGVSSNRYFLSRSENKDNLKAKLAVLNRAKEFVGDGIDLSTLNPILTEIMTNTNNHAGERKGELACFISVIEMRDENKMCFCMIDLGVGIYESVYTKGGELLKQGGVAQKIANTFFSYGQSELLASNIPVGVKSSTKLLWRGKGLKEVYYRVQDGPYVNFDIITNKARVNLLDILNVEDDSEHNIDATIYYWELEGVK